MKQSQKIISVKKEELVSSAKGLLDKGYRLVQISGTRLDKDSLEINYSFDKKFDFVNFRLTASFKEEVPSITSVCFAAFLYENEVHELFGIKIKGIAVDFQGHLYKLSKAHPFNPK
jgi:ech hydrogenase subunit D